ncbi:Hypothetical protein, putative [Bodo saltans]|uniref:Regulator of microtubule dynamics protein 1 n=1 Tax=Bodo saltans TaxID=75058 RepID=A0A0S4IT21_BODSA|nr:Hypothetical protein, putative [Bodo saltans]|eukprot:CUF36367.1 Hypothetical protein, putative [Bodo saltans]
MSQELIAKAEELQVACNYVAVKTLLFEAIDGGDKSVDLLWRGARNCYDLAQETQDKAEKEVLVRKGFDLAKTAIEVDPSSPASHKWIGILYGSLGEFIPTKDKIANAYVIRDHFLKSVEINPKDATTQHCMGKWCWTILQIGWIERQAASLLFGTPPSSTNDECRGYLLASHEITPTIHNCNALGDLYYQEKNWAEAKKWFSLALTIPAITENHKRQHEEATKKRDSC